jgi:hypothetical protein
MEPHKLYNYGAAGLRSVLLNCGCPPAFAPDVTMTRTAPEFVGAVTEAARLGPLAPARTAAARRLTWASVARSVLVHMAPAGTAAASEADSPRQTSTATAA